MNALRTIIGGLIVFVALAAFVIAVIALIRGHIAPLRIRSRRGAAGLLVTAVVAFVLSGLILPPSSSRPASPAAAASSTTQAATTSVSTATSPNHAPSTTSPALAPIPTASGVITTTSSVAPRPPTSTPVPTPAVLGPGARDPQGVPVPLSDGAGATATVTLNGVRYAPVPGTGQAGQLVVLDFTIIGTSIAPFHYSQNDVHLSYLNSSAEGDPAYAHSPDRTAFGSSPSEDYTPFLPPDPLRVGVVSAGQQKHGLVIIRAGSSGPYIAFLGTNGPADRIGQWAL